MEVFWSKGYAAASTAELCDATGLGRSSLYNAFGSKHELYEAALSRYADRGVALQVAILEAPGTAKTKLRNLMEWVIDTDLSDPTRRGCMTINAATETTGRDDAVVKLVSGQFQRLEAAIHDTIIAGQRAGEITTNRPASELARSFLSTYYGLRVLGAVAERETLEDVVRGTVDSL
ncbi:TetR/AcrR family transcriptional regulator [Pseudonocardia phyllosphaerae]|uniref:TetR/AcrR family transcriptional regulator n=1 Tax=Pseudonocardia phyllosphaerae TaxID=3390502 RepID=UPI00397B32C4